MSIYNNPEILSEIERLESTSNNPNGSPVALTVPSIVEDILGQESSYSGIPIEEMPSRVVFLGSAVTSLIARGEYIDFVGKPMPDPDMPGYHLTPHRPLSFPRPGERSKIDAVIDSFTRYSDGEATVSLSQAALGLLESMASDHRLTVVESFSALTGLVNHIGQQEREGLELRIYPDGDPRFKMASTAP